MMSLIRGLWMWRHVRVVKWYVGITDEMNFMREQKGMQGPVRNTS